MTTLATAVLLGQPVSERCSRAGCARVSGRYLRETKEQQTKNKLQAMPSFVNKGTLDIMAPPTRPRGSGGRATRIIWRKTPRRRRRRRIISGGSCRRGKKYPSDTLRFQAAGTSRPLLARDWSDTRHIVGCFSLSLFLSVSLGVFEVLAVRRGLEMVEVEDVACIYSLDKHHRNLITYYAAYQDPLFCLRICQQRESEEISEERA